MARKSAARPPQRARGDGAGSSLLSRALARTRENPATTGGLLVMAVTGTAIVSNALFLQGEPQIGVPPTVGMSAPVSLPALAPQETHSGSAFVTPPMPRLAPRAAAGPAAPEPRVETVAYAPAGPSPPLPIPAGPVVKPQPAVVVAPAPPELSPEQTLVADIQRELARLGLYSGAIDGLTGPRTDAAIRTYETAADIPVTGIASEHLLAALKQRSVEPVGAPILTASTRPDSEAEELNRRERERARLIAEAQEREAAAQASEAYRAVQAALNRIGYGPVPVDGNADPKTLDAIRRFELDNGMPVTGQANDALIARLVAIGAIRPG